MKIKHLAFKIILLSIGLGTAQYTMGASLHFLPYKINISKISMAAGWIGTILYIVAYLLLCLGKLTAGSKSYHLLNILGAFGLIVNAADMKDYPSFVVNIIWMIIAAITFFLLIKKKKSANDVKSDNSLEGSCKSSAENP